MSAFIAITDSSGLRIGKPSARCASASSTSSVGMLPTSASCAKGHPPRPPSRRVKAAAARIVSGQHLGHRLVAPAVQVRADLEVIELADHRAQQLGNLLRRGQPDGVGQRNGADIHVRYQADRLDNLVRTPRIAVWIAERHRDVDHHIQPGVVGLLGDLFQQSRRSPQRSGSGSSSEKFRRSSREIPACAPPRWRLPARRPFRSPRCR